VVFTAFCFLLSASPRGVKLAETCGRTFYVEKAEGDAVLGKALARR
jgi:hypothetical protein